MKTTWKKASALAVSLLMTMALFAGCNDNQSNDGDGKKKVAFVCSAAGQNDTGYNKSAVDALKKVADELGLEANIVEPTNGVPAALEEMAEQGYELIFSLEYDFDALIKGEGNAKPLAEQYPDTHFVVFNDNPNVNEDGSTKFNNVTSVLFDVHEASYLAGYLYVHLNENNEKLFTGSDYKFTSTSDKRAVGFIGGTNSNGILVYSYGFMQGINDAAKEYDNVKYDYYAKYDAGFTDTALGNTTAGTFFSNGANIVFADCGSVGDGITARAKEDGKLAIQVDANLDSQQPGYVLTSVLKITGVPVDTITRAFVDGTLDSMDRVQNYDLASGATGITDLSTISQYVADQDLWNEIVEKTKAAEEKIKNDEIDVVNAQAGETLEASAVPNVNIK